MAEDVLIDAISNAFQGVLLGGGTSLNEARANDAGGDREKYLELAKGDERQDWRNIASGTLESFPVLFSFMNHKGLRFFLPAYMIWTIRNHKKSDLQISDATIYAIDPDNYSIGSFASWFSPPQIAAMISFLEYCAVNDDSLDAIAAREKLQKLRPLIAR